jgi:secretion/DNA translocation related TadE-like protein
MTRRRGERGTVTAELALALPSVVLLLGVVLAVGELVAAQVRCLDAARAGVRLAARGEPAVRVGAAVSAPAPGAAAAVERSAGVVRVRVRTVAHLSLPLLPGVEVSATAEAADESALAGGLADPGSGTVLALVLVVMAGLLAATVALAGQVVVARHRAAAAADLAALAVVGAAGSDPAAGCAEAVTIAAHNHADLQRCLLAGDGTVTVATTSSTAVLPFLGLRVSAVGLARAGPAPR